MAREDLHFRLRIPEDVKRLVEAAAAENHRSMTAEIVARLQSSFTTKGALKDKLEAIAAGTFVPGFGNLGIFDEKGFDPSALEKALRELATQIAVLRHEVKDLASKSAPGKAGEE